MSKTLSSRVADIESRVARLLTLIEGQAAPAPKAPRARKATTKTKATPKAAPKVVTLRSKSLAAFVEAHPWAQGKSVREAAEAVMTDGMALEPGWVIGERYRNLVLTGSWDGVAPVVEPVAEVKVEPKAKAKRVAKPAKPVKAKAERGAEPEYGTDAWIAWARPTEDGAPRNAKGGVTPKGEWKLRMALAEGGRFDRFEIDAVVAQTAALGGGKVSN